MSKCIINIEDGTITIKTALSENDKIAISAEGYQNVTFIVQGEHLFNIAWKHDENTHWKECMIKDCAEKTDVAEHNGGQATCQKKAECEVCSRNTENLEHIITEVSGNMMKHHIGESARQKGAQRKQR